MVSEEQIIFRAFEGDKQNQHEGGSQENSKPDPYLEEGESLPVRLQNQFPPSLANKPLEEIDPFYNTRNTFIVINKGKDIFRFSATNALWVLNPLNPLRKMAICMSTHSFFSWFINTVLIINYLILIMPRTVTVTKAQIVFTVIYTLEILVKVVARGFIFQPFTYLRDPWNWLDFIVTILDYVSMAVDISSLSQSFRMIRLLKIATATSCTKIFAKSVTESVKIFRKLALLALFLLTVVSILGLQMYMGVLTQKCVKNVPGNVSDEEWEKFVSNETNWYWSEETDTIPVCGNSSGSYMCPYGFTCLSGYGSNPDYGYTNFDSFGWAFLSSLRLKMQDYWESLYHMVLKSAGPWHVLFFVLTVFLLSWSFLSLTLAVVFMVYNSIRVKEEKKQNEENLNKNEDRSFITKVTDVLCIWECCQCWKSLQKVVGSIIFNPFVEFFFLICIILNTIFMALDHHDMSIDLERVLRRGYYFFITIFAIEITLKIVAMSPKPYFKKKLNILDFITVTLSLLELMLEGVQGLAVFRIFLLLRVFRVTNSFIPAMDHLTHIMFRSFTAFVHLSLVFLVTIYIFALIGMNLFGLNYIDNVDRFPEGELPRWNFTDFLHSFMMVFRAFCGEWIESMWDCMLVGDISCIPFFFSAAIIGKLVVVNLFLCLILSSFGSYSVSQQTPESDEKKLPKAFKKIGGYFKWMKHTSTTDQNTATEDQSPENCFPDSWYSLLQNGDTQNWLRLRYKTFKLVQNKYFEYVVIIIICISSLVLASEDIYLPMRPHLQNVIYSLDITFTVIFSLEMLVMWLGLGLKKYFTTSWCILDFIVVVALLVHFGSGIQIFKFVRVLRLLRLIRPMMSKETMELVINTILQAKYSIFYTLILCGICWLPFAVIGVQMFAGKFFKCVDSYDTTLSYQIVTDKIACMANNYTWTNSRINFDNVANAYLSLFQVATFKGWIMIMNDAIDSREIDKQPIRETNIYMYLYFVVFIMYGSFFTANFFVGVLFDSYSKQLDKVKGRLGKLHNVMNILKSKKLLKSIPKPDWKLQSKMFDAVTNKKFEVIMLVFVGLDLLTLALDEYQATETLTTAIDYLSFILLIVFILECIVKIFALRHHYFKNSWNLLDFTIVIFQILGLILSDVIEKYFISPTLLRFLRVLRVHKIRSFLRSVKMAKFLRILYHTLTSSMSTLLSVWFLLFIFIFIYSIFGMYFFKYVKNDFDVGFQTFGQSTIALLQITTLAGWDNLFYTITNEHDCYLEDSTIGETGNCGNFGVGVIYMLSFLFMSFLILSTYIATVIKTYEQVTDDIQKGLSEDDCNMFFEVWQQFDPEASGYINYDELSEFLDKLEPPLQIPKPNKLKIGSLDIPICENNLLYYGDILYCLACAFYGVEADVQSCHDLQEKRGKVVSSTLSRQQAERSAKVIQDSWRIYKNDEKADRGRQAEDAQTIVLVDKEAL